MTRDKSGRMVRFGRFPRLETERLILRRMTLNDVEYYFEHFSRKEIVEGQGEAAPKDVAAAEKELRMYCIDNFRENTGIRWGIVLKGRKGLIGTLGFYRWSKENGYGAQLGYDLDPEFWDKGIMTEAMTAVLEYGFETMRMHRFEVWVMPHNRRSVALVRRLGFKREGLMREHLFQMGEFQSDVVFSMLEDEWRAMKKRGRSSRRSAK